MKEKRKVVMPDRTIGFYFDIFCDFLPIIVTVGIAIYTWEDCGWASILLGMTGASILFTSHGLQSSIEPTKPGFVNSYIIDDTPVKSSKWILRLAIPIPAIILLGTIGFYIYLKYFY